MKKLLLSTIISVGLLATGSTFAESCTEPADVSLPDGATSSTEEMVGGQQAVKKYVADGEVFLNCMEEVEKANAETVTDEEKAANVQRYNAVVDKMQTLAQSFNDQIKAYKAAQAEQ